MTTGLWIIAVVQVFPGNSAWLRRKSVRGIVVIVVSLLVGLG